MQSIVRLATSDIVKAILLAAGFTLAIKEILEIFGIQPGSTLILVMASTFAFSFILVIWVLPFMRIPDKQKNTSLDEQKKSEIMALVPDLKNEMIKHQKEFQNLRKEAESTLSEKDKTALLYSPAWVSIAPTDSKIGKRLIVGLRNTGCRYRKKNRPGCLVCGYNATIVHSLHPSKKDISQQLHTAISKSLYSSETFDVLEFLGDGSFMNDKEVGDDTKRTLFDRINNTPCIERVLVESRPEDIDSQDIEIALNSLNRGQKFEIGIGLETSNNFIRNYCINKGFLWKDFVNCVEKISKANVKNRLSIVAYIFVKPLFLSEKEAIEDAVQTLLDLKELSKRIGIKIIPKLEPAVITSGSVLDIQNQAGKYEPVSLFSVVEIVMHAHKIGFGKILRIGGRYDMYFAERIPGVYSQQHEGMLHQWDFIIYEALMTYNTHHNIKTLLADLSRSMNQDCFKRWEAELFGNKPSRSLCTYYSDLYKKRIGLGYWKISRQGRHEYLDQIFKALDEIEYFDHRVKDILSTAEGHYGECSAYIEKTVLTHLFVNIFESKSIYCTVDIIYCYLQNNGMCRVFFKLKDLVIPGQVSQIWVIVPLNEN